MIKRSAAAVVLTGLALAALAPTAQAGENASALAPGGGPRLAAFLGHAGAKAGAAGVDHLGPDSPAGRLAADADAAGLKVSPDETAGVVTHGTGRLVGKEYVSFREQ
ncbi:hypothetical protein [Streptomyces sp. H27-D2]|uniref:hypothetical protein n=1 Tax=Streptomyces sp. H27-D2 TaxID=3046304 RepID=UPI002DB8BDA3|nr:hypothetical protein [Streptomyces sp. H27-D2]MEC4020986.1 hypothetical protein [Streptomyces sp. H27-D2]